jgi:hypothetical protein
MVVLVVKGKKICQKKGKRMLLDFSKLILLSFVLAITGCKPYQMPYRYNSKVCGYIINTTEDLTFDGGAVTPSAIPYYFIPKKYLEKTTDNVYVFADEVELYELSICKSLHKELFTYTDTFYYSYEKYMYHTFISKATILMKKGSHSNWLGVNEAGYEISFNKKDTI